MTSPESPPTSAEAAASVLYGLPADDFVARRDQLVKQIRADGDRSLADAIKALRKPTVVAASLNHALRGDPTLVERLLEAVAQLRRIQEAALSGETGATDAGSFAARLADYRSAVDAVVAVAPSHPVEVRAAVEAAAIGGLDDELEAAVFAVAPQPDGGFGPFVIAGRREDDRGAGRAGPERGRSATTIHPDSDRSAGEATGKKKPSAAQRRLAERARKAAEKALADSEAEHRAAEETAAEARQAVEALDERLRQLSEELEDARRARDDAIAHRAAADAARSTAEDRRHQARLALEHLNADNAVE